MHTKSYKVKLEKLHLGRLTRRDQAVRLLDIQRLEVVKIHKPIATNLNTFKHVISQV
jgi:hypothetical protein